MPYNLYANGFHIKKLCDRICSRKVHFLRENVYFAVLRFRVPLWGLRGNAQKHIRYKASKIWNQLPSSLKEFFTVKHFSKIKLKEFCK